MSVFKHDSYIDSGQIWTTVLKDVLPQTLDYISAVAEAHFYSS